FDEYAHRAPARDTRYPEPHDGSGPHTPVTDLVGPGERVVHARPPEPRSPNEVADLDRAGGYRPVVLQVGPQPGRLARRDEVLRVPALGGRPGGDHLNSLRERVDGGTFLSLLIQPLAHYAPSGWSSIRPIAVRTATTSLSRTRMFSIRT